MRMLALVAALLPGPLLAQDTPMTAAEFEAFVTGKTLSYGRQGEAPYGTEEYLPDRQVRWAFTGEECKDGVWYAEGALICFVYDDDPEPQCWQFFAGPDGLRADFAGREDAPIYSVRESEEPLFCPGPRIGV
ncbi:MAG: hypothetical protein AAFP13_14490 [Pseudomonadota bacterium]